MTDWNLSPTEIEAHSLAIIDAEAGEHGLDPRAWSVVRRMIHTTADFEFIQATRFSPGAVDAGIAALKGGATIFTDTRMAQAGISPARVKALGLTLHCLVADPAVAEAAKRSGTTRSVAAVDAALPRLNGAVCVIGNAPTALFRLIEHIQAGRAAPALVVGLPVGFVNAAESKQALLDCPVPFITALGRKGGSAVAASVVNALADLALAPTAPV